MSGYLNTFFFGIYPYIAIAVLILGSLIRYDREPYSWRAGSSQLLRRKQLMWGSNLFHWGILVLFIGHLVGLLTPHSFYAWIIHEGTKEMMAIVVGSIAGIFCLIGLTMLVHRRLTDPRIRATSSPMDIAILLLLWLQLVLGLVTVPYSLSHPDSTTMLVLAEWTQQIVIFQLDGTAELVAGVAWPYKLHLVLGLTIFLLFPFSRLVHIWSAPVKYLARPGYQVVRTAKSVRTGGPAE